MGVDGTNIKITPYKLYCIPAVLQRRSFEAWELYTIISIGAEI